jgi:hypothetical protein
VQHAANRSFAMPRIDARGILPRAVHEGYQSSCGGIAQKRLNPPSLLQHDDAQCRCWANCVDFSIPTICPLSGSSRTCQFDVANLRIGVIHPPSSTGSSSVGVLRPGMTNSPQTTSPSSNWHRSEFGYALMSPRPSTTLADLTEGGLRAASHSACIVVVEAARRGRGWLV